MSLPARLGKNILWTLVSRCGSQVLMVLFTILVARRMGSVGFGEYAFIAAVIFLGNAVTTFGTDMLLIREIASGAGLGRLPAALLVQLGLSVAFIAAVWVGAPFLPNQNQAAVQGLQIYSLALIPLAFFSVFTTALRGKQRMDSLMALNLAGAVLQLAAGWAVVMAGGGIASLAAGLLGAQVLTAGLGAVLCQAQIPGFWRGWQISLESLRSLIKSVAPFGLLALVGILYQKLSVMMLATLAGPQPTGWFSAAARAVEAAKIVHLAVFTALYPAMAQAAGNTGRAMPWSGSFRNEWRLLMAGAGAAALAIFFLAGPISRGLFGSGFEPAILALQIMAWMLIPFTANTFLSLSLLAANQEYTVMRVQGLGLAVLVALNTYGIPRWGLTGACLALVLAESVQLAAYLYFAPESPFRQKAQQGLGALRAGSGGGDEFSTEFRKIR